MHKLTIAEAAERLGVSSAAISIWESGKKSPTLGNLIGMAELYGVTTDCLLGRSNEPQDHHEKAKRCCPGHWLRHRNDHNEVVRKWLHDLWPGLFSADD